MTTDANTKKLIQDHYKIDVDAIRNLSKLTNDLTKNGKLRVPGGLEVDGDIMVKRDIHIGKGKSQWIMHEPDNNDRQINICPAETAGKKNWNWNKGIKINHGYTIIKGNAHVDKSSTFNGPTNFKNQKTGKMTQLNQPDGNIYLRGNDIMDGHGNSGKDLHVHSVTNLKKDLKIGKVGPLLTHFNVDNKGENFIRGNLRLDGSGGHKNDNSSFGQGMHLIDLRIDDDRTVLIRNASGQTYHKDAWVCMMVGYWEDFGGPHGGNNEWKYCFIGPHNHWHFKSHRTLWNHAFYSILCIPRTMFNRVDHNAREYK